VFLDFYLGDDGSIGWASIAYIHTQHLSPLLYLVQAIGPS